jgi:hypothetical protein
MPRPKKLSQRKQFQHKHAPGLPAPATAAASEIEFPAGSLGSV